MHKIPVAMLIILGQRVYFDQLVLPCFFAARVPSQADQHNRWRHQLM